MPSTQFIFRQRREAEAVARDAARAPSALLTDALRPLPPKAPSSSHHRSPHWRGGAGGRHVDGEGQVVDDGVNDDDDDERDAAALLLSSSMLRAAARCTRWALDTARAAGLLDQGGGAAAASAGAPGAAPSLRKRRSVAERDRVLDEVCGSGRERK